MAVVPVPSEVFRWSRRLAGEVAAMPRTIAQARRLLLELPLLLERLIDSIQEPLDAIGTALPALAERVEALAQELADTRTSLDAILPELSQLVGGMDGRLTNIDNEVGKALGGLDERLGHMDEVVSELGQTLTGVLGSIPGLRRSVRAAQPH